MEAIAENLAPILLALATLVTALTGLVVVLLRAIRKEVAAVQAQVQQVHVTFNDKMDKANAILAQAKFAEGGEAMRQAMIQEQLQTEHDQAQGRLRSLTDDRGLLPGGGNS
jgi:hypothetical protein